jgi:hypothetical protein
MTTLCRAATPTADGHRRCSPTANNATGKAPIGSPNNTPAGISSSARATGRVRRKIISAATDTTPAAISR